MVTIRNIWVGFLFVIIFTQVLVPRSQAQSFELQQLILNVEKLNSLKAILSQLKNGYEIVSKGYNTIKTLTAGNFNIHKTFLDGLLSVSPTVKNYKKVAEIIRMQQEMVQQYKSTFAYLTSSTTFNSKELEYIKKVYGGLIERSLNHFEELLMIVTSGELRMNDAERLSAIDRIHSGMSEQKQFCMHFTDNTTLLALQRQRELQEIETIKKMRSK